MEARPRDWEDNEDIDHDGNDNNTMTMARKNNNGKPDPAALTQRVGVIEMRDKAEPHGRWRIYRSFSLTPPREDTLAWTCGILSGRHTAYDFRYRLAALTFDDDGRNCTIY